MTNQSAIRYLEQKKRQQAELRAKVAEMKAVSKQEVFDFDEFAKLYDVTEDYGSAPIPPEIMERYEEEYYLGPVRANTIREFAERMQELKLHDAN